MIQKVILDVDLKQPLSSYGDGHVIVFDSTKNRYYATTRELFLKEQNEKIELLSKNFDDLKMRFSEYLESSSKSFSEYLSSSEKQYSEFMEAYKKTNEKIIEMVKSVIVEEK